MEQQLLDQKLTTLEQRVDKLDKVIQERANKLEDQTKSIIETLHAFQLDLADNRRAREVEYARISGGITLIKWIVPIIMTLTTTLIGGIGLLLRALGV